MMVHAHRIIVQSASFHNIEQLDKQFLKMQQTIQTQCRRRVWDRFSLLEHQGGTLVAVQLALVKKA
jgi:hypothetical protein